jgi:hypothetical protein
MENKNYFSLEPSIGKSFSYGWSIIFNKPFLTLLLAVIISGLLKGLMSYNLKTEDPDWFNLMWIFPAAMFSLAYSLLFIPVISYGVEYLFLRAIRYEEADLKYLFEGFKNKYLKIILANLIVSALVIVGFALLIVPGIIALCRLAFVPYLVMDKEMEPVHAVEKSWQMTRGYGWKIFWMGIVSFFIIIGGFICFFVGVIISFMWIHSAFATLYQSVLNKNNYDNPIPVIEVYES